MKVSFHRRRHDSLPPTPRRSPRVLVAALVLGSATMGLAAANLGDAEPHADPLVLAAEQASRDATDDRLRLHLRRLR